MLIMFYATIASYSKFDLRTYYYYALHITLNDCNLPTVNITAEQNILTVNVHTNLYCT